MVFASMDPANPATATSVLATHGTQTEITTSQQLWQLVVEMVLDERQDAGQALGQHAEGAKDNTLQISASTVDGSSQLPRASPTGSSNDIHSKTGQPHMLDEEPPDDVLQQLYNSMDSTVAAALPLHSTQATQTSSLTPRMLWHKQRRARHAAATQAAQQLQQQQASSTPTAAPAAAVDPVSNEEEIPAVRLQQHVPVAKARWQAKGMGSPTGRKVAETSEEQRALLQETLAQWEHVAFASSGGNIAPASSNTASDRAYTHTTLSCTPTMMLMNSLPASTHWGFVCHSMWSGRHGEQPALFKLLDPDIPAHAQQIQNELQAYTKLRAVQGRAVPRLLHACQLANGLFAFVYQQVEGQHLSQLGKLQRINKPIADAAVDALQLIHTAAPGLLCNVLDLDGYMLVNRAVRREDDSNGHHCMLINLGHATLNHGHEEQEAEQYNLRSQLYGLMGVAHELYPNARDMSPAARGSSRDRGSVVAQAQAMQAQKLHIMRRSRSLAVYHPCWPARAVGAHVAHCRLTQHNRLLRVAQMPHICTYWQ